MEILMQKEWTLCSVGIVGVKIVVWMYGSHFSYVCENITASFTKKMDKKRISA